MAEYISKLIIIGSGPAGYTAGIYAARAGLNPILVSGNQVGGQLTMTSVIENFPGFTDPISGNELMENMRIQAINSGVEIIDDKINEVDFSNSDISNTIFDLYSLKGIIVDRFQCQNLVGMLGVQIKE